MENKSWKKSTSLREIRSFESSLDEKSKDEQEALDVAAYAGHILLECGAEIFRVEETIDRITNAYGIKDDGAFVLSSGIFLTSEQSNHQFYAKVKHIPLHATYLDRVAAVNQLSREISEGKYTPKEAMAELNRIQSMPDQSILTRFFAFGLGSGCFCYVFGGSFIDSIAAFISGVMLAVYMLLLSKRKIKTAKITQMIGGGMVITLVNIMLLALGLGNDLNHMIIGSIMPMLPGVAFTNAIRDFASEDYISGIVRMVDAVLVACCIAIGVGIIYSCYYKITGGW